MTAPACKTTAELATQRADGRHPGRLPANRFHEAAWIVGDRHRIAPDVWIGAFCVIDAAHDDLTIGDGSVIAAGAQVYTHSTVRRTRGEGPLEHAPTKIGSRVSVCAGAIVLMGCEIGDGAVIGAGAVVRERTVVPAGETWAGVPARRVRWDEAPDPPEPERRLTRNAARCLRCKAVVESRHVHEFTRCPCGAVAVDGGLDYLRRVGDHALMEDLSEYAP